MMITNIPRVKHILLLMASYLISTASLAVAADIEAAPVPVRAAILLKILGFNKSLSGNVTIHVVGEKAFSDEMTKSIGKPIGSNMMLESVELSADLPATPPSVLYIGDEALLEKAIAYGRENKVFTVGATPDMVRAGTSLGTGIKGGKPAILLNPEASKQEGIEWNPAILKIATIIN